MWYEYACWRYRQRASRHMLKHSNLDGGARERHQKTHVKYSYPLSINRCGRTTSIIWDGFRTAACSEGMQTQQTQQTSSAAAAAFAAAAATAAAATTAAAAAAAAATDHVGDELQLPPVSLTSGCRNSSLDTNSFKKFKKHSTPIIL